jgi:uncharacterized protein YlxW (UPF0749 family)
VSPEPEDAAGTPADATSVDEVEVGNGDTPSGDEDGVPSPEPVPPIVVDAVDDTVVGVPEPVPATEPLTTEPAAAVPQGEESGAGTGPSADQVEQKGEQEEPQTPTGPEPAVGATASTASDTSTPATTSDTSTPATTSDTSTPATTSDTSTAETVPIPERAPEPVPYGSDRDTEGVADSLAGPTVPLGSTVPVAEPVAAQEPSVVPGTLPEPGGDLGRRATGPEHSGTSGQREPQGPEPAALDARDARGRLASAMRPRATRGQLLGGLLCAVLAFALVTQARSNQSQGLSSLRQTDLVRILAGLTDEATRLEEEARTLQSTYDELRSGSGTSEAAEEAARQRLETLGILTGATRAVGPGIQLEINDPENGIGSGELLDTLQELRDAGAEAVQIGDVRVVASTAFSTNPDETGIRVDGRILRSPYVFRAIGDPQTLASALEIPGGALEMVRQQGGQGRVTQSQNIEITAVRSVPSARHASPAPPSVTP